MNTRITTYKGIEIQFNAETGKFFCDELAEQCDTLSAIQKAVDAFKRKPKAKPVAAWIAGSYYSREPFERVQVTSIVGTEAWITRTDNNGKTSRSKELLRGLYLDTPETARVLAEYTAWIKRIKADTLACEALLKTLPRVTPELFAAAQTAQSAAREPQAGEARQ